MRVASRLGVRPARRSNNMFSFWATVHFSSCGPQHHAHSGAPHGQGVQPLVSSPHSVHFSVCSFMVPTSSVVMSTLYTIVHAYASRDVWFSSPALEVGRPAAPPAARGYGAGSAG